MAKPQNHDEYIASFPIPTHNLLQQLRGIVHQVIPEAVEVISYSMPAFKLNGKMLTWFAGHERHIGFYPGASTIAAYQQEISGYKNAKGSVQFPLDRPLPVALITGMVQFKAAEIMQNTKAGKLPAALQAGVEALSGTAMDNVRVHYNSAQPAQLKAKAYAQGSDIHIAPGEESHVPHESWHVVQQRKGRVKPTMHAAKSSLINNEPGLEEEADKMGKKAQKMNKNK